MATQHEFCTNAESRISKITIRCCYCGKEVGKGVPEDQIETEIERVKANIKSCAPNFWEHMHNCGEAQGANALPDMCTTNHTCSFDDLKNEGCMQLKFHFSNGDIKTSGFDGLHKVVLLDQPEVSAIPKPQFNKRTRPKSPEPPPRGTKLAKKAMPPLPPPPLQPPSATHTTPPTLPLAASSSTLPLPTSWSTTETLRVVHPPVESTLVAQIVADIENIANAAILRYVQAANALG